MPVPAMPGTGLEMVKAEIVLCPLEALLDGPAQPGSAGQFRKAGANSAEDEITCQFLQIPAAAAPQQAVFPTLPAVPQDDKAGPVMEPRSLGPLTGGKGRPVLIIKFFDQLRGVGGHDAPLADEPQMVIAAERHHPGTVDTGIKAPPVSRSSRRRNTGPSRSFSDKSSFYHSSGDADHSETPIVHTPSR